ncbi:glycoside hydrolase family 3 protein [Schizopora paradoxa]|uniref:beta-glucosidase n=1 Tax=Schizopora paradoxa TaxID=27342 RepID=A0A0H2RX36_9AGAM|nr:glycoside hydrolase family 3 protein [Schizopora paradoxa]
MRALSPLFVVSISTAVVLAQQTIYSQCGGIGWTGGTTCVSGTTCTVLNSFKDYSQCLPSASASSSSVSHSSSSSSSTSSKPTSTSSSSISIVSSTPTSSASSTPTPTSVANISPEWVSAYTKANAAVAKMSLTDKVNLGTGVGWMNGNCVGNTPAISSINFPGLCLEDSPLGVRYADFVSAFPPAINVAATFNRTLMNQRGVAMGEEFRGKGVHIALGPMMNLMRAPAAGRNWEGFGGDPFLSGEGAFETVSGIQSVGVQAVAKHYINNEQEHSRTTSTSNVDDFNTNFTLGQSVQANVASVMCSYNQINSSYACENDKTLNGILKGEFGFQGYVMSDWGATHSTPSVNAGLDEISPLVLEEGNYFGPALISAVQNGSVSETRINDLATRILAAWYLLGQDSDYPPVNFDAWNLNASVNTHVNVQADHATLIREIGAASTVLLKNVNGTLPLNKPKTIAIVGNGAGPSSKGPNGYTDRGGDDGVLAMGWGSGTDNFPYLITPLDAITNRSEIDGTTVTSSLSDTDTATAQKTATGKDIAFVFITADSGEGYITVEGNFGDRNDLNAWHSGDALVEAVATVNKNTVVVVNSVGPIIMENWINHPNVTAVVWSGLPGQEAGNGLTDVLFGAVNPSGRLPYTIGKSINDYSAVVDYTTTTGSQILSIPYTEGIFIDYRHFDQANIEPRFEFGFGLSYTNFTYSDLTIVGSSAGGTRQPNGPGQSLDPWLHDKVINVTFTVANSGSVDGTEIPQLYTTPPASANVAPMNLKGFDSVFLKAGQSTQVTMQLSRFDLSTWDVVTQRFEVPSGTMGISVGASSRDIRLKSSIAN